MFIDIELDILNLVCEVFDLIFIFVMLSGGIWFGNGIIIDGMFDFNLVGIGEYNLVYIIQDGVCIYGVMEFVVVV